MNVFAYIMDTVIIIGVFSILSLSIALQFGFTGLVNFGVAAFFLIGGYTWALVTMAGYPSLVGFLVSLVFTSVVGLLVSFPALKLKSEYLALATLVFAEIVRIIVVNVPALGGAVGLPSTPQVFPITLFSSETFLILNAFLIYGVVLIFYLISYRMLNSPYGRIMRAIREDEGAAQALGKDTVRCKYQVFALGSAMAGIAGALYVQYIGFTGADLFTSNLTFTAWIMCITGGSSSLLGALIGAVIIQSLARWLRIIKDFFILPFDPHNIMFILTGILMVVFITFRPEGIFKEGPIRTIKKRKLVEN